MPNYTIYFLREQFENFSPFRDCSPFFSASQKKVKLWVIDELFALGYNTKGIVAFANPTIPGGEDGKKTHHDY